MSFTYKYPRPSVTVDCFVLNIANHQLNLLLVKRKNDPYKGKWALPGGFVDLDENLADAAIRELKEETGFDHQEFEQLGAFGEVNRDPRGRTISVVFYTIININEASITGSDDADEAKWVWLGEAKNMAFDHDLIVNTAIEKIIEKIRMANLDNQSLFKLHKKELHWVKEELEKL